MVQIPVNDIGIFISQLKKKVVTGQMAKYI
jgi:hypothetical protein